MTHPAHMLGLALDPEGDGFAVRFTEGEETSPTFRGVPLDRVENTVHSICLDALASDAPLIVVSFKNRVRVNPEESQLEKCIGAALYEFRQRVPETETFYIAAQRYDTYFMYFAPRLISVVLPWTVRDKTIADLDAAFDSMPTHPEILAALPKARTYVGH